MRRSLVLLVAVAVAAVFVALAVTHRAAPPASRSQAAPARLDPRLTSYLGVYETGPPFTYQPVTQFARAAGKQPNLVGYYSGWGVPFSRSFAETARRHGAVTVVQLDPTDVSIPKIAGGGYDGYLRAFATSVRDFGHPVVIGFGHEMNADWYSWGYGHVPAATFVAAWRHVVSLFRSRGADNVTWLWTINQGLSSTGPAASWWPGARYVSWVGIDGYYYRPSSTFATVFGQTIAQVREFTRKPVLLSEAGVGPRAGQYAKIRDLFAGMRRYQTLGLVWFDIAQHDGIYHQDWRIEDHPAAVAAFRLGASSLRLVHP
jgi:mannan endo-1,4-beta-mannosidase